MKNEALAKAIVGSVGALAVFGACAITGSTGALWALILVIFMMEAI
ncbi:hypothetical protein ABE073_04655 [Lederbergia citrisecunda]